MLDYSKLHIHNFNDQGLCSHNKYFFKPRQVETIVQGYF